MILDGWEALQISEQKGDMESRSLLHSVATFWDVVRFPRLSMKFVQCTFELKTKNLRLKQSGIRIWWTYEYHFPPKDQRVDFNINTKHILFGTVIEDGESAVNF